MINLPRRILKASPEVGELQIWLFLKDLVRGQPEAIKLEDIRYPHAHVAYARASTALRGVSRDT
jgi:hypothetical protein